MNEKKSNLNPKCNLLINGSNYFEDLMFEIKKAKKSIKIVGWDFDLRIKMQRGPTNNHLNGNLNNNLGDDSVYNSDDNSGDNSEENFRNKFGNKNKNFNDSRFGNIIYDFAIKDKNREVKILIWNPPVFYMKDREHFTKIKAFFSLPSNVIYGIDDQHPVFGCHHEKIVLIDEKIAYVGGLDLSSGRWDNIYNDALPSQRYDKSVGYYDSFRDVMVKIEGENIVSKINNYIEWRWAQLNNEYKINLTKQYIPWIKDRISNFNKKSGISLYLTLPKYKSINALYQILFIYKKIIKKAKKEIYIENQYLASKEIINILIKRLKEKSGPYVTIIVPGHEMGFLEGKTMGLYMIKAVEKLRKYNNNDRLGIFFPAFEIDGQKNDQNDKKQKKTRVVKVHSKLIIVDDCYFFVGSANLNERSMKLDSETNVLISGFKDDKIKEKIKSFKQDLIVSLCGTNKEYVSQNIGWEKINKIFLSFPKRIKVFAQHNIDYIDNWLEENIAPELEKQSSFENIGENLLNSGNKNSKHFFLMKIISSIFLILVCAFLIYHFHVYQWKLLDIKTYQDLAQIFSQNFFSGILFVLMYVLLSVIFFPLNLFIIINASIFPPIEAIVYSFLGALGSAFLSYFLGFLFGSETIRLRFPKRFQQIQKFAHRGKWVSVFMIRLIPIAPYGLINLICGSVNFNKKYYLLGTVLGLFPGILTIVIMQKTLVDFLLEPELFEAILLVFMMLIFLLFLRFIKKRFL